VRTIGIFLLLALWPMSIFAEVKTTVSEDGIPFVYNETSQQRGTRLSSHLRQVSRQDLQDLIVFHADRQRLSQRLVQAVIQVESGYNPNARSHKGAMGRMQLMPATARSLSVGNAFDPNENIRGGTDYLRSMLDRFGDLQLALAAYNAGPGAVERYRGIPPYRETTRYVERVLTLLLDEAPAKHAKADSGSTQIVASPPRAPRRPRSSGTARSSKPGPKIYVSRGTGNKIVMTTTPPARTRRP